ncbi:transcriptional regulator [Clostridium sp. DSM 8431]|uniref:ROK family protein n=1 Tax=Clostridium sp. DSM 8431 TaxID=1761781 RepID=UPI0008ECD4B7|nr:ROK family protein [Clostridium sp. DSM 8431]SFU70085.1 transcriptional regulator [Clostridium sp. DSM 8431]
MKIYEVFDIGGSSVKASLINEEGKILNNEKIEIAENIEEFFDSLANLANKNKKEYPIEGIAISAPGAVDSETGIIGGSSAIPYIHGPNFKEILGEKTGLKIELENDANCAALGECWLGAGKEEKDLAFVVCGSGIGGAIVKDNRIHKGIHKHGGEFGYSIVGYDEENAATPFLSWSAVGSTTALARNVATRKGLKEELDGLKVFELFNKGDKDALEEVEKYYRYMAIGIYNIQYTYDPEVIILGGAICEREDFILNIEKYIDKLIELNDGVIRPVIRKCVYGNNANKLGALYHFITKNNK